MCNPFRWCESKSYRNNLPLLYNTIFEKAIVLCFALYFLTWVGYNLDDESFEGGTRMYVELLEQWNSKKRQAWRDLLRTAELEPDEDVTQTALLWDEDTLVATASRRGNLLKCIAVADSRRGEDLTSTVLSALRQEAFAEGYRHLFLYTKPQNAALFSSVFFYPVAKTNDVLLMENRRDGISEFLNSLSRSSAGGTVGAVVMNCNPFTKGHRYLIETAAKDCDHLYVFVVAEDKSRFPFADRLRMVQNGTADLANVTVLSTGPYLISSATFPTYFLKQRDRVQEIQCALDIEIFTRYFVPHFGITRRYIGEEPLSPMTAQYNEALKRHLPPHGITCHEIPRLAQAGHPISASEVRRLMEQGHAEAVAALVPATTFEFLKENGYIE